jgi:streptogramin lyase
MKSRQERKKSAMIRRLSGVAAPFVIALVLAVPALAQEVQHYDVPPGDRAHDVVVTRDGEVWRTVQRGPSPEGRDRPARGDRAGLRLQGGPPLNAPP